MQTIAIVTPAYVSERKHVEMMRVHSLTAGRLAKANEAAGREPASFVHYAIYDHISPHLKTETLSLPFHKHIVLSGTRSGIRRPTQAAINAIASTHTNATVLRLIQDTFVTDPKAFISRVIFPETKALDWVSGAWAMCDDISPYLAKIGLKTGSGRIYDYIQGAVVCAPLETWRKHYPRIPKEVLHYCEDSTFSQIVLQSGGELLFVPDKTKEFFNRERHPFWWHRHDEEVGVLRSMFREHGGDADSIEKPYFPTRPYVVIAPMSHWPVRSWNKWDQVVLRLEEKGLEVVVVGVGGQYDDLHRMMKTTNARVLVDCDADAMTKLILGARLTMGNDSGIPHFAGMLGKPAIAVHAGSLPHEYLFSETPSVRSVTAGRQLPRWDNNEEALHSIPAESVMAAAEDELAKA